MSNIESLVGPGRLGNLLSVTLAAYSNDDGGGTPSGDDAILAGTLVVPSIATEADEMLNKQWRSLLQIVEDCPAIPAGYSPLTNASIAFTNDQSATVVLTLDAGDSMSDTAFTDSSGVDYDRNQLATIAAHQFISQKSDCR